MWFKNDTMLSLESFNAQLSVIMKDFAKAVIAVAQINEVQNNVGEQQEDLDVLVDGLCLEAIAKILRIVELLTTATKQQQECISPLRHVSFPTCLHSDTNPISNPKLNPYGSVATPTIRSQFRSGDMSEWREPPQQQPPSIKSEETEEFITVLITHGIDEPCGSAEDDPENAPDDGDDGGMSPSPTHTPLPSDHEYARPSSPVSADANAHSVPQKRNREREKMMKALKRGLNPMNHPCERCTEIFPSEFQLTEHHRKEHSECPTCGELFPIIKKLIEHEITVHGIMPYKCDYCDKGFIRKGQRNVHVRRRHTEEKTPAQCDICGKTYANADCLRKHTLRKHTLKPSDKSFACDVCGKSFYHADYLRRHKRVHANVKPHLCPTCGRGFTTANSMMKHQDAVHAEVKQTHLCSACGKCYTSRQGLSYHMVTCSKRPREKQFRCHTCGKSFKMKQQLKFHMYNHTGETPYKCTICDKTFSNPTNFIRHKSIHSGETPYSCKECGKHFRLLSLLKQHERSLAHKRRKFKGFQK